MNKKSSNEVMVTPYGHIYELEKGTIKKRCGYCKFAEPRVNAFLHCVTCHCRLESGFGTNQYVDPLKIKKTKKLELGSNGYEDCHFYAYTLNSQLELYFAIKCCNELTKNQMKLGDTLVERAEMFYKFTKERAEK